MGETLTEETTAQIEAQDKEIPINPESGIAGILLMLVMFVLSLIGGILFRKRRKNNEC